MENINENKVTIDKIEKIVKSKNGKYLTIGQYDEIKSLMLSNKSDLLNDEENWKNAPSNLRELVEDSELYYGFNETEIKKFLQKVNKLGYTFNYVDVATKDNGGFDHTVEPYALRKMDNGGSIKSKGTFRSLGTSKELGITPNIVGHDMIAKCDCGEKFSYQNSKKNIIWECPECKGMKRIKTS
jgi:hypothetical protein